VGGDGVGAGSGCGQPSGGWWHGVGGGLGHCSRAGGGGRIVLGGDPAGGGADGGSVVAGGNQYHARARARDGRHGAEPGRLDVRATDHIQPGA
jgi:hypothetical protein